MDHVRRTRLVYGRSADRHLAAVGSTVSDRFEAAADLEVLARFAQASAAGPGRSLDAGCGTGRVARVLADAGCDVTGVDVAPGMVDVARREHPDLCFVVGELARLPLADARFGAVAYWYSIITTPPGELGPVWAELARVLLPRGAALVAFQSGDGTVCERPDAYGSGVDLTLYRHDPALVEDGLVASGLEIVDVVEREPVFTHEDTTQSFVVARAAPS